MKVVDFFKVVIKIMGIIILVFDPYGIIINLLSEIFRPDRETYIITLLLLALSVVFLLSYLCIFRTESIVNLLRLNKGYESKILENININSLLSASIFVVGGILIAYSFSNFLISLIYTVSGYFNEDISLSTSSDIKSDFLINLIDLIIGLLIIINIRKLSALIGNKL